MNNFTQRQLDKMYDQQLADLEARRNGLKRAPLIGKTPTTAERGTSSSAQEMLDIALNLRK